MMKEGNGTDEVIPLVEGEDYYLENGLMVLTEHYHLRRGYCCDQGCRHCPYSKQTAKSEDLGARSEARSTLDE